MKVLLVDWLGRGGIAQLTGTIRSVLSDFGASVRVATRPGRELTTDVGDSARTNRGRLRSHLALIDAACREIDIERPDVLIVQNYLIPHLEARVLRAAHQVGARAIVVVHDGRLHSALAGTSYGLGRLLSLADEVVVHSAFVGEQLARLGTAAQPMLVPHGRSLLVTEARRQRPDGFPEGLVAAHFGVLNRSYKGTDVVTQLGALQPAPWKIVVAGVGAQPGRGLTTLPGFLPAGTLAGLVDASTATLLPYRYATQSGAVALSQALGTVPVVSAVGGLPEQVEDGRSGVLIEAGAPVGAWLDALRLLEDGARLRELVAAGLAKAAADHVGYREWVRSCAA